MTVLIDGNSPYWSVEQIIWYEDKNTAEFVSTLKIIDYRGKSVIIKARGSTVDDVNAEMNSQIQQVAAEIEELAIASGTSPSP